METVSAALIVKNEKTFLPGCLASLEGHVDEIVIVDTGSSDGTREIAMNAGARVIDFAWRQDFAAARNTGLDAIRTSWILYIDADERLILPDGLRLATLLENPVAVGARVKFKSTLRGTAAREYRVFRNRADIRFVGAIHETMVPDLMRLRALENAEIIDIEAGIDHLGYEGDITHKHRRNLPMLRRMVQEWPDRLYYWLDLARALVALGEIEEARAVSIEGLARAEGKRDAATESIAALIALNYSALLLAQNEDAGAIIAQGLAFQPGAPPLLFLRARHQINAGDFTSAIVTLDQLMATDPATYLDSIVSFDERLLGAYALELKSVALLRLGDRPEAAACLRRASELEPAEISYRVKAIALGGPF
ncbi:glycosyltransferase family 2 protein [Aestuariivirga litoralis]|uniref:glycosyltransferase family 2 protein n=1 Tax=Aestuariivirga litoralis TaxID=2650924 RepID=UPI0018C51EFC|nr:glycosyltransferase family 2 protein [Aestuariivirga litoralis]MBG1231105.1 glycosyltransferase [Aestuariivirga litoralis]